MSENGIVLALGFFDGVHTAHRMLLDNTREAAKKLGCTPCVIVFDKRPQNVVTGTETPTINTVSDRVTLIRELCGIENTIKLSFTHELMNTPWDDFISGLIERYNVKAFSVGYDFRFGKGGDGDGKKLLKLCGEKNIGLYIMDRAEKDGVTVSSTKIRELLSEGRMREANSLLGHAHMLTGEILSGKRIGRTIGIPTANMVIPKGVIMPKKGVYAVRFTTEDGNRFRAVTNIGTRPTVNGGEDVTVESHLLGFDGNIYGTSCRVEFMDYLREEQKFSSLEMLKKQIDADIAKVEKYSEEFFR